MRRFSGLLAAALLALVSGCSVPPPQASQPGGDRERGRLLYDTACVACHTSQAHWREKRAVDSWTRLVSEVAHWQRVAGLTWSEEDIHDVAAYLNALYYKLPCPRAGCGGAPTLGALSD